MLEWNIKDIIFASLLGAIFIWWLIVMFRFKSKLDYDEINKSFKNKK